MKENLNKKNIPSWYNNDKDFTEEDLIDMLTDLGATVIVLDDAKEED